MRLHSFCDCAVQKKLTLNIDNNADILVGRWQVGIHKMPSHGPAPDTRNVSGHVFQRTKLCAGGCPAWFAQAAHAGFRIHARTVDMKISHSATIVFLQVSISASKVAMQCKS